MGFAGAGFADDDAALALAVGIVVDALEKGTQLLVVVLVDVELVEVLLERVIKAGAGEGVGLVLLIVNYKAVEVKIQQAGEVGIVFGIVGEEGVKVGPIECQAKAFAEVFEGVVSQLWEEGLGQLESADGVAVGEGGMGGLEGPVKDIEVVFGVMKNEVGTGKEGAEVGNDLEQGFALGMIWVLLPLEGPID